MKKLFLFILSIFYVAQVSAQCGTTIQINHVICNGSCNGSVTFTPATGTPPYWIQLDGAAAIPFGLSYVWTGICAGTHHYVLTDSLSTCTDSGDVIITEPSAMMITPNVINQSCNNTLAMAYLFISGGTPPYSVLWSTGDTGINVMLVVPGLYTAYVTDANACTDSVLVFYNWSPPVTISFTAVNPSCSACNDGSITALVNGGNPPYTYLWTPGGITTPTDSNLSPGIYSFCVTDANGCVTCASYPLLDSTQHLISGHVYYDLNNNGSQDSGEPAMNNQHVRLAPGPLTAWTSSDGNYYFIAPGGTYTDTLETQTGWHVSSSPFTHQFTLSSGNVANLDFGIFPDAPLPVDVYGVIASNTPRCNSDVYYSVNYYNYGTQAAAGYIQLMLDSQTTFVSSSTPPDSVNGNSYFWNYSGLIPGNTPYFYLLLHLPAPGISLNTFLAIYATDSLGNLLDSSSYTFNQNVRCSYDPNDKSVNPPGISASHDVPLDSWLDYTIRFQNTGNDTALTVVITDTLSPALDVQSFQVVGSSHLVSTVVENNSIVRFHFDQIHLPDSTTDESASHGWILYRIKALTGIPDPTTVNNTAYIYFDQNVPVATNMTLNTLTNLTLNATNILPEDLAVTIYPNPMKQFATVKFIQKQGVNYRISLLSAIGQMIRDYGTVRASIFTLEKQNLKSGICFLRFRDNGTGKEYIKKLVIE